MSEKILTEINNNVGVITLNSEKSLNSLDKQMCQAMAETLDNWSTNKDVFCVLLQSAGGKAFCAGGDVVSLYKSMKSKEDYHKDFFKFEYKLDLMIHQFQKPIIVLASGIVMGGGIGIMNGASHRIVTETTKLAMPEITIGLFPDVGGSYFLNKMPGSAGLYLGMTGTRFYGSDALFLKMADYYISSDRLIKLKEQLFDYEFTDDINRDVTELIEHFSHECKESIARSEVKDHLEEINLLCDVTTVREFKNKVEQYTTEDKWMARGIRTFLSGSPTSMSVIFEQLKRGKGLTVEQAFEMESKMALNFGEGHDFCEGVRALLIDKDGAPKWSPKILEEVTEEVVDSYFL